MTERNIREKAIDEKIKKQKEVVAIVKDKYKAVLEELNLLIKKKQDLQGKELLNAFVNSDKSLDEILAFMGGKNENNEWKIGQRVNFHRKLRIKNIYKTVEIKKVK